MDKCLATLGTISFSIYVMHNLVIAALNARVPLLPVPVGLTGQTLATGVIVVLPLVLIVSTATYLLIERPFLLLRRSYLVAP